MPLKTNWHNICLYKKRCSTNTEEGMTKKVNKILGTIKVYQKAKEFLFKKYLKLICFFIFKTACCIVLA
jgi:hypothetical protein